MKTWIFSENGTMCLFSKIEKIKGKRSICMFFKKPFTQTKSNIIQWVVCKKTSNVWNIQIMKQFIVKNEEKTFIDLFFLSNKVCVSCMIHCFLLSIQITDVPGEAAAPKSPCSPYPSQRYLKATLDMNSTKALKVLNNPKYFIWNSSRCSIVSTVL